MSILVPSTVAEFIAACDVLDNNGGIYMLFENVISDELRAEIYTFADGVTSEPIRSSINNLGKLHNISSMIKY